MKARKGMIIAVEVTGSTRFGLIEDLNSDLGPNSYLYLRWQDNDAWSAQPEVVSMSLKWREATNTEKGRLPSPENVRPLANEKKRATDYNDPKTAEEQRSLLADYFKRTGEKSKALERVFRKFWEELMNLRPERPGQTWRMRTKTRFGNNPALLIRNPKTLNDVQLAHFWASQDDDGLWISIIVLKNWLEPQDEPLFPSDSELYGQGRGVDITLNDFTGGVMEKYVRCFQRMLTRSGDSVALP
jgi:hypothetical protein